MTSFLIVDDEDLVRRALTTLLARYGECVAASSAADAAQHLESGVDWDGFMIDVLLGDGSGLDILVQARRSHPRTPAVILTGTLDREVVNRAATLNARVICKPYGAPELAPFLSDVLLRSTGDRIYAANERARHRWGLSQREAEILEATLRGLPRDSYIRASGMTINTYKSHVRKMLDKADYENLASMAIDLLSGD